jgi:Domain of unknown function (DUF4276)
MARVNIVVEGQTEEAFVNSILKEPLAHKQIYLAARAVETSRDKRANKIYRGGLFDYARTKRDILRWLKQDQGAFVTTMFDFYALPRDFPGYQAAITSTDLYQKVAIVQQSLAVDIASQRFIPYIQLHEFEALLFSDIDTLCNTCNLSQKHNTELKAVRNSFSTPEHINDNPQTAPSKRILSIHSSYEKIIDGVQTVKAIGLTKLRGECLHFNAWLEKLERLAS